MKDVKYNYGALRFKNGLERPEHVKGFKHATNGFEHDLWVIVYVLNVSEHAMSSREQWYFITGVQTFNLLKIRI